MFFRIKPTLLSPFSRREDTTGRLNSTLPGHHSWLVVFVCVLVHVYDTAGRCTRCLRDVGNIVSLWVSGGSSTDRLSRWHRSTSPSVTPSGHHGDDKVLSRAHVSRCQQFPPCSHPVHASYLTHTHSQERDGTSMERRFIVALTSNPVNSSARYTFLPVSPRWLKDLFLRPLSHPSLRFSSDGEFGSRSCSIQEEHKGQVLFNPIVARP